MTPTNESQNAPDIPPATVEGKVETERKAAFWKWLREYVEAKGVDKFGQIHPGEIRTKAMASFGLRGISDVFTWQKNNRSRIVRAINAGLKAHGLRIARNQKPRSGYLKTEKR